MGISPRICLAIAALATLAGCSFTPDTTPGGDSQKALAKVMCEEFVDRNLKAPASADYGSLSEATVTYSGGTYTVDNYVDAENSFGAQIRTQFTCEVLHAGGDQWKLVDLTGLDN